MNSSSLNLNHHAPSPPSMLQPSKMSGFLLATLSHSLCNVNGTDIQAMSTFDLLSPMLIYAEQIGSAVLWHPGACCTTCMALVWNFLVRAPPLIQLIIAYFLVRITIVRCVNWAVEDYQSYLDLGRGGTPSDLWGWWRCTRLKFLAAIDVLEPPHVPPMLDPYRGILWRLTPREGSRPLVKGIAPQRQINQKTHVDTFDMLLNMISTFAAAYPDDLSLTKSFLEGHTTALKLNKQEKLGQPNTDGEFGFEICHPHRNDGSLHMVMHPEDVRTVIEAGWGERHPLATNKWYWRMWYHIICEKRKPVPEYLVLIYAPRTDAEVKEVYTLIRAAIWFATKKVVGIPEWETKTTPVVKEPWSGCGHVSPSER